MEVDSVNLPWIEKYRPDSLKQIVSHGEIIKTLTKFIEENKFPHLLFYGPPGTGKTTAILAAANQLFTKKQKASMVLELNASDDRGINVVRENIISFAQTKSLHTDASATKGLFKLVILDEADAMTKDAQNALRRVIEKYTENVRFCIICNYLSSIIPPIQSRCTRFRFAPLELTQIIPRLDHVIENEKLEVTEDGKKALLSLSGGDMRRVLNVLQSVSMAFDNINEDAVYSCVGQPTPKQLDKILQTLWNDSFSACYKTLTQLCVSSGFALTDIVTRLHLKVCELDLPQQVLIHIVSALGDSEEKLSEGCSEKVQIAGLVAIFTQARQLLDDAAVKN
ncbi:unnamed protein product [Auanema sp. JU1783]|nr:unnamed protein product [Auanema sp. JU1783]